MTLLDQRVALVTGAANGIGRAIVEHAHEVFRILRVLQAICVRQLHAIGVVGGDHEIA